MIAVAILECNRRVRKHRTGM